VGSVWFYGTPDDDIGAIDFGANEIALRSADRVLNKRGAVIFKLQT